MITNSWFENFIINNSRVGKGGAMPTNLQINLHIKC